MIYVNNDHEESKLICNGDIYLFVTNSQIFTLITHSLYISVNKNDLCTFAVLFRNLTRVINSIPHQINFSRFSPLLRKTTHILKLNGMKISLLNTDGKDRPDRWQKEPDGYYQ